MSNCIWVCEYVSSKVKKHISHNKINHIDYKINVFGDAALRDSAKKWTSIKSPTQSKIFILKSIVTRTYDMIKLNFTHKSKHRLKSIYTCLPRNNVLDTLKRIEMI